MSTSFTPGGGCGSFCQPQAPRTTRPEGDTELKFSPSILTADFARLGDAVAAAEEAGADWIHLDVMDGRFVPNLTFGPKMVADLRRVTRLPLDVHLMIDRPDAWITRYAEAGADWLTVHLEATADPAATIAAIRAAKVRPGVTLRPGTDVARLLPLVGAVDLVLVMSVEPGFGGQAFIPSSLERVRTIRTALDAANSRAELEVDGGVKVDNAGALAAAGASVLVAGSAVFNDPDGPRAALARLRAAADA